MAKPIQCGRTRSRRRIKPSELKARSFAQVRCGVTGKWFYRSEGAADHALANAQEQATEDPRRREVRSYQCDHCGGWHLTSNPRPRHDPL